MSEDVSATMRVGITVILVASLISVVLNLMVMSNSLLTQGQAELQSGVTSLTSKEFDTYNSKKVRGTQVRTAIDLFEGRDIAIVVQTTAMALLIDEDTACNYCALLTKDGKMGSSTNKPEEHNSTNSASEPWSQIISNSSQVVYTVKVGDEHSINAAITRGTGNVNYTGYLYTKDGMVETNQNHQAVTEFGNPCYIRDSGIFVSTLIQDINGETIGIYFRQIK